MKKHVSKVSKISIYLRLYRRKIIFFLKIIYHILFVEYPWYLVIIIVIVAVATPILWTWNFINGLLSFITSIPFRLASILFRYLTFADLAPKEERWDFEEVITRITKTLFEYNYTELAREVYFANNVSQSTFERKGELLLVLPKLVARNIDYELGIENDVSKVIKLLKSIS